MANGVRARVWKERSRNRTEVSGDSGDHDAEEDLAVDVRTCGSGE